MEASKQNEAVGSKVVSWWRSLPKVMTATGAVITALVGLIAGLNQAGLLGSHARSANAHPAEETPLVGADAAAAPVHHKEPQAAGAERLARRIVGRWTWSGQGCAEGPRIASEADGLSFTTPTTRFVHRVVSDDGSTLRTKVLSPAEHGGEGYRFQLNGNVLAVFEDTNKERNVWTRCHVAAGQHE